jgi:gamma-glutamyl phosphate reductase
MQEILKNTKIAQKTLLNLTPGEKKRIILEMARQIKLSQDEILQANKQDVALAQENGLSSAMIERLKLDEKKIADILASLEQTANLSDPIGRVIDGWVNHAGLRINKIAIPIGVVCVIYESRPNVSAEVASLCFKSSNAVVLKGGSEAQNSNLAIIGAIKKALKQNKIDENVITFLKDFRHKDLDELLKMDEFIDVIIPRGGEKLVSYIAQNSKIPVIKHDKGMCHIFVDESADLASAVDICVNAKCQKPSACNAVETLLIHEAIAAELLPVLQAKFNEFDVKIHGESDVAQFMSVYEISEKSYETEYLDYEINIKIVRNLDEAIEHISRYSSHHSEAILSRNSANIDAFFAALDSACLYANASTRFSDGFEFGFGAEIGISTNKLHARGPMGLNELTTYKYQIIGDNDIRK